MSFERKTVVQNTVQNQNTRALNARGVTRAVTSSVGATTTESSVPLGKSAQSQDSAPAMGGVQSRESQIAGAFYLDVKNPDPVQAWEDIVVALKNVSVTDTTVKPGDVYTAFSMKYFQNTYALARSMLCYVDGEEGLKLEINRHAGDGFGFADLFVKEFSGNLGEMCSQPVFVVDPELEAAKRDNQGEEFLDLAADVGHEMVEHWLTSLRPSGGMKYDANRFYEALSSLGWNCQDASNYEVLKEYTSDIVTPIFEVFLRQQSVDHTPSVYYGSKILKQFAEGGDLEMNNTTVASICAIAFTYCNPDAERDSTQEIQVSKQSLQLLFEALEIVAPQIDSEEERDEDMLDAMTSFLNAAAQLFGDNSMDERITQLASTLNVEIEELVA